MNRERENQLLLNYMVTMALSEDFKELMHKKTREALRQAAKQTIFNGPLIHDKQETGPQRV